MSFQRKSSIKRQEKSKDCFINGVRVCRYCKGKVKPPRRTFCSDECVHNWRLSSDHKYLKSHIYLRDLGKCSICKIDTRYTKIKIEDMKFAVRNGLQDESSLLAFLKDISVTIKESEKSLFHIDHILPVSEGGGQCEMDNLRTLCISCHKHITKVWRKTKVVTKKLTKKATRKPSRKASKR